MKRTIALGILAVSLGAPISAKAAQTAASATPQSAAQLTTPNARFTLLDQDGNVVGVLVADGADGLRLREIGRASATIDIASPRAFRVDYSKALTPQQMGDAYRAASDEFFHVDHTS
jgi:hypothetical protein